MSTILRIENGSGNAERDLTAAGRRMEPVIAAMAQFGAGLGGPAAS